MITQKHLKEILFYNPDSGIFIWIKTKSKANQKIGDIAGHKHKNTGYISMTIDGKFNAAHRLVFLYMTGKYPKNHVDHLNRNRSDNRWCNLKDSTNAENCRNTKLYSNNKSGVSGVFFDKNTSKWEVKLICDKKKYYFGRYKDINDAIDVRNKEIKKLDFSVFHGK